MKKEKLEYLRKTYPPGTRVVLDSMDDPMAVPEGTAGIVQGIDDEGSLLMQWDNGRTLMLLPGVDQFHREAAPPLAPAPTLTL